MTETLLDLDNKKIRKEIFLLVIPIILENIFQISANVVSAAMIGRFAADVISAQGICTRITGIIWALFKGIGIGVTIVTAKLYSQARNKCQKAFEQAVLTTCTIALIMVIVIFLSEGFLISFFSDSTSVISYASTYLKIIILGAPFLAIMNIVTGTFQGHGNTKTPMYIAIIVNIVNVCLGYTLIYGKFGAPRLGLAGAGIALITAQIVGALLGLYFLYNHKTGIFHRYYKIKKYFIFDKELIKEIYLYGIPAAFETMFWQLSAIVMSKVILSYGNVCFAAYQLGLNAENIVEMPAVGLGVAATALSAKAIGEQNEALYKAYGKELVRTTIFMCTFTSLFLLLMPNVFMDLLSNNQEIKNIGAGYIIAMGFIQIPQNLIRIYGGFLRSAGYKNIPMFISAVGIWGVRVPISVLSAYVFKIDISFIWIAIALDQVVKCALSYALYKYKKVDRLGDTFNKN